MHRGPHTLTIQRFKHYLNKDPALQRLSAKLHELRRLELLWQAVLPSSLARRSAPSELAQQRMTVVALDGATASKIQQMSATLVKSLQQRGCDVRVLLVRVGMLPFEIAPPPAKPRAIDSNGRQAIATAAESLPTGPLQNALRRLLKS